MTTADLQATTAARLDALTAAVASDVGEAVDRAGVLVALSGGPDSVALLDLTTTWARRRGRPVAAAHFHHGLRPGAADADRAFCTELCATLDVPLHTGHGDPRPVARQRGRGLEDAARQLRLDFLERTRAGAGLTAIALGHHRDDQTETVLLNLLRGSGLDGLRGMPARRGRLMRPLLPVRRAALLQELARRGLSWREDATNRDGSNRRGRVRCELLPLIRDIFGPGAQDAPARLADLVAGDLDLLDDLAGRAANGHRGPPLPGHHGPSLACAVAAEPEALARRVIHRWLADVLPEPPERIHVEDVLAWLRTGQSGTGLDLPGPVRLERVFDRVGAAGPPPPPVDPAAWRVHVRPLATVPSPVPPARGGPDRWELVCPADALQGGLHVRAARAGERLRPLGRGGTRKLSDLFQESRVAASHRAAVPVVADDAGPLWVPGVVQDERTRVLPSCRQALTIILERRRSDPVT
jgi:tRNA(Ile)-lysidine synthase